MSWDEPGAAPLEASGARYLGTTWSPSPVRRFPGRGLLGPRIVDLGLEAGRLRVHQRHRAERAGTLVAASAEARS